MCCGVNGIVKVAQDRKGSIDNISTNHGELFAKFQTNFCAGPLDAVLKALGVERYTKTVTEILDHDHCNRAST